MNAGWLWFVVAVVLAGVELLTLDLVLVMLAAALHFLMMYAYVL